MSKLSKKLEFTINNILVFVAVKVKPGRFLVVTSVIFGGAIIFFFFGRVSKEEFQQVLQLVL
jgi:hypothetical protein